MSGANVPTNEGSRRQADRRSRRLLRPSGRGAIDPEQSGRYVGIDIQNVITNGDVARGLPPCSACHQVRTGGPIETPTLTGQYAQYIKAQLRRSPTARATTTSIIACAAPFS